MSVICSYAIGSLLQAAISNFKFEISDPKKRSVAKIILKPSEFFQKRQLYIPRRAVALLGENQLGKSFIFLGFLVIVLAVYERHHVRVLLDRARFAKIRH